MQLIADMVESGASVADIGTDHGFIPIYLYQSGKASKIVLTDIADGPLSKARENIAKFGLSEDGFFSVRKGSGIEPLQLNEVSTVIIAGMGGELISSILEQDIDKSKSFDYLILQPRTMCDKLRKWLEENEFKIVEEHLVEEGPQIAQLFMAVPIEKLKGRCYQVYHEEADYSVAPLLFDKPDELLKKYLIRSIRHAKLVCFNLNSAKPDLNYSKLTEWQSRVKELENKLYLIDKE